MIPESDLLAIAGEAVDAGARWLGRAGVEWSRTRFKASGEEVTDADVEVERRVTAVLRKRVPDLPVIGEETSDGGDVPPHCWLLDPIDGTMNFTRHGPMYALSLALVRDGVPSLGVLHAPALGRRWSTGRPADRSAGPGAQELSRALVGITGTGSRRYPWVPDLIGHLHLAAYRLRMHGAMSMDLLGVSEGWLDACVCVSPKPWDVAAGIALVRERGKVVLGAGGDDFTWASPVLVAGEENIARQLARVWDTLNDGAR